MECPFCDSELPVVCCDDMCRGLGECIHGDGYGECLECLVDDRDEEAGEGEP